MGLLGNKVRTNLGVHMSWGSFPLSIEPQDYMSFCYSKSQDLAASVLAYNAIPSGAYPPSSFLPPQTNGEMSLRVNGEASLVANLYPTRAMSVDFTGSGDMDATAALVISMLCAMTGSGDLEATITGFLNASIDLTGSGGLSADMQGIASMLIDMFGEGTLEATVAAYGNMTIDIKSYGELSVEGLRDAIWNAVASNYTTTGTMGQKLNSAASGGVDYDALAEAVWDAEVSGNTGSQAGKLLSDIKKKSNMIPGLY